MLDGAEDAGTHLDTVTSDDIDTTTALGLRQLEEFTRALSTPEESTTATLATLSGTFFGSLPEEFRNEIEDPEGLKNKWINLLRSFCNQHKNQLPTKEQKTLLLNNLLQVVLDHLAFNLINNSKLDTQSFDPRYKAEISNHYLTVMLQKVIAVGIWVVSGVLSYWGLTHYFGEAISFLEGTFSYKLPVFAKIGAREGAAILGSAGVSQIVQIWKERIENIANESGTLLGTLNAPLTAVKREFTGKTIPGKALALGALFASGSAITFDYFTNVNGIFTGAFARRNLEEQIAEANGKINNRVAAIQAHSQTVSAIPNTVGYQVQVRLDTEKGGASETGASGAGPMWNAKELAWNDNRAADLALTQAKWTDWGGPELRTAVYAAGVVNGKPINAELSEIITPKLAAVAKLLAQVKSTQKTLDAQQEPEYTQEKLDKVVQTLEETINILNEELPRDIDARMKVYGALNLRLVEIAKNTGKYKNLKPDKIENWLVADLRLDNSEIEVGQIEYVDISNLWETLKNSSYSASQITILLLAALTFGVIASYSDMATLAGVPGFIRSTPGAYKDDVKESEEKQVWINDRKNKICKVLTAIINAGPFAKEIAGGTQIDPAVVEQTLDQYLKDVSELTQDNPAFRVLDKLFPLGILTEGALGRTEVAQRHNAQVKAIKDIFRNKDHLNILLNRLLPGRRMVRNPNSTETLSHVQGANIRHIEEKNAAVQNVKLMALKDRREKAEKSAKPMMTLEGWIAVEAELDSITQVLGELSSKIYPSNKTLHESETKEATRALKELRGSLPAIVNRITSNLTIRDGHPDEEMNSILERLNHMSPILEALDCGENQDLNNERQIALRHVERIGNRITEVKQAKTTRRTETARLERIAAIEAEDRQSHATIKQWHASIGSDPRLNAIRLCNLLGQQYLIESLSGSEKISEPTQHDLNGKYEHLKTVLRRLLSRTNTEEESVKLKNLEASLISEMEALICTWY